LVRDWTDITARPAGASSYTAAWPLDFASLQQGANYVSVRAWDAAGSTVTAANVFFMRKDTVGPAVADNQPDETV
jgi:hypothetical protein